MVREVSLALPELMIVAVIVGLPILVIVFVVGLVRSASGKGHLPPPPPPPPARVPPPGHGE